MTYPHQSAIAPHKLRPLDRQLAALELRKMGKTFAEIAQKLHYANHTAAYKAVQAAIQKLIKEPADDVLKLELERLDALWHAIWPVMQAGDPEAITRGLAIMQRRARYLGLDAPAKHVLSGPEGGPIEIADARQRLARQLDKLVAGREGAGAQSSE